MESFHFNGRVPRCSGLLKRRVNDVVILAAAHSYKKRIDILSGPEAFFGSRWNRTLYTSLGSKIMTEIVLADMGEVEIGFSKTRSRGIH